jgi:hypothetical protein
MRPRKRLSPWPAILLGIVTGAHAADEYSFDTSAFEKKPFELGGYVQAEGDALAVRRDSVFGRLLSPKQATRERLNRALGVLQLVGKVSYEGLSFRFLDYSAVSTDQIQTQHDSKLYEADLSYRVNEGITLNAGKRVLRWGTGYAWNPVGFVERPKDPSDPSLPRQGYVMATGDFVKTGVGPLSTLALTGVALPANNDVNDTFGQGSHVNVAAKVYALVADTDIDVMGLGKGSRPGRIGFDFSRNIHANLEIHGEWARIFDFQQPVIDAKGTVTTRTFNATSWLVGLRYLTERDVTWIAEYYRNGAGYDQDELEAFLRFGDAALASAPPGALTSLVQRAVSLAQGGYGQPNPGRDYLYVRASAKEPGNILYFTPAVTAIVNVQDGSFTLTPEFVYTGFTNWELRGRVVLLQGARYTEFGERPYDYRIEFYARYYF